MPRPPNYNQERKDRDRIKAAKKAEKLAAKQAKRQGDAAGSDTREGGQDPATGDSDGRD